MDIRGKRPLVTVVMPSLNEEAYIGKALRSLLDDWAIRNCEMLVVDGGSTDRTKQVVEGLIRNPPETSAGGDLRAGLGPTTAPQSRPEDEVVWFFSKKDSWVRDVQGEWNPVTAGMRKAVIRLLDNPGRIVSLGMNLGIAQAAGRLIARADAHCIYPPGYVRRCVELLADTGAASAGGVIVQRGEGGRTQEAIALARSHFLGTGGGAFRKTEFKGEAEGAVFGTFRKELFDEIGGYDIKAIANQDSELNVRIICAGKKIFVDSDIKVTYFPRKTLKELASQYFRYGRGWARTAIRHKMLTGWRQAAAPMLLLVIVYAVVRAVAGQPAHLIVPTTYALGLVVAALFTLDMGVGEKERTLKGKRTPERAGTGESEQPPIAPKTRMIVAAAWSVMHLCWGAGFLYGLIKWR